MPGPRLQPPSPTRLVAIAAACVAAIVLTWFLWSLRGGDETIPTIVQVPGFLGYAACAVALHPRLGRRRWRYVALVGALASVLLVSPVIMFFNWCLQQLMAAEVITPRNYSDSIIWSGFAGVIVATSFSALVLYVVTKSRLVTAGAILATMPLIVLVRYDSNTVVFIIGSLWHIIVAGTLIIWGLHANRRFAPGRCTSCGYDIRGLAPDAPACPECGQPLITTTNPAPAPAPAASPAARR